MKKMLACLLILSCIAVFGQATSYYTTIRNFSNDPIMINPAGSNQWNIDDFGKHIIIMPKEQHTFFSSIKRLNGTDVCGCNIVNMTSKLQSDFNKPALPAPKFKRRDVRQFVSITKV